MTTKPRRRIRIDGSPSAAGRWISLVAGAVLWRAVDATLPGNGAYALGYGLHVLVHCALAGRSFPAPRRWAHSAATGLIAGALGTLAWMLEVAVRRGRMDFVSAMAAARMDLFALPWWVCFAVAGAALVPPNPSPGLARLLARTVAVGAALYAAAFLVVFDIRGGEPHPFVEQPDSSGRPPVVGPKITLAGNLLCPGTGPCFLWSCDHLGDEWIFRVWRPAIDVWFQSARFHDPDRPGRSPAP